jgi:crossover junction endodeoxyribonuclease RuvC
MRILGIDPGLKLTGYGIIEWTGQESPARPPTLIDAGVLRLDAKSALASRLYELYRELDALFEEFKPAVCAVEQLYAHYNHPRTAILMGHARGVILLTAQRHGATIKQYAANRIKQSVAGHGHAGKQQMQRAIQLTWSLPTPPDPPDVADALAIALCCGRAMQVERAVSTNNDT